MTSAGMIGEGYSSYSSSKRNEASTRRSGPGLNVLMRGVCRGESDGEAEEGAGTVDAIASGDTERTAVTVLGGVDEVNATARKEG